MKQFIGISKSCDLIEAVRGLHSPNLIFLCVSEKELFQSKEHYNGQHTNQTFSCVVFE